MNIKNKIFIVFVIFLLSFSQADVFKKEANLNYISTKVPKLNNIECKFKQDKFIQTSNIHLKSGGDFKFDKNKGVVFMTTYPIKSTVTYENREYKQINKIIKAISAKNFKPIEKEFAFYFEEKDKSWDLGLKPKKNSSAFNYVKSIEIIGKNDIEKIVIMTTDNVKTTMEFFK